MFGSREKLLQDKSVIERAALGTGLGAFMGFLGGSLVGSLIDMKTLATVLPKNASPMVKGVRIIAMSTVLGGSTIGLYAFGEAMAESVRHTTGPINAIYGTALATVTPLLYYGSVTPAAKFFVWGSVITAASYLGDTTNEERTQIKDKRLEEGKKLYEKRLPEYLASREGKN